MNRCLHCYEKADGLQYHPHCAKKVFGSDNLPEFAIGINEIEQFATQFLSKRLAIPGVQRKLSVHLQKDKFPRFTIVGSLGGGYILKPPSADYQELPANEDLTMMLAELCGIQVAVHSLIPMADGSLAYITKRFDRTNKLEKIHVEDFCQLSELATEQKYRSSHEQIGKIIAKYSSVPGDDALRFFELVLFCFLTGNADMHLKNFSFITDDLTFVRLSPAYDLLSSRLVIEPKVYPEEVALSLNGKKCKITRKDFLALALNLRIPTTVVEKAIERIAEKLENNAEPTIGEELFELPAAAAVCGVGSYSLVKHSMKSAELTQPRFSGHEKFNT